MRSLALGQLHPTTTKVNKDQRPFQQSGVALVCDGKPNRPLTTTRYSASSSTYTRPTLSPLRRVPLAPRDDAIGTMRNMTATDINMDSGYNTSKMSFDKRAQANVPFNQTPKLAAVAKRAPITPKLATTKSTTLATPLIPRQGTPQTSAGPRKILRAETTLVSSNRESPAERSVRSRSPVNSFLLNNVTPRSSSRQTRVDSTNTSPVAESNAPDWDARSGLGITGSVLDGDVQRRGAMTFAPSPSLGRRNPSAEEKDAKFFHASDASSVQPPPAQSNARKAPTFFYANGEDLPDPSKGASGPTGKPASPRLAPSVNNGPTTSRFMHANGVSDTILSRGATASSVVSSVRPSSYRSPAGSLSPPAQVASPTPGTLDIGLERSPVVSPPATRPVPPFQRAQSEVPARPFHSRSGSLVRQLPNLSRPALPTSLSTSAVVVQSLNKELFAAVLQTTSELQPQERPDSPEPPVSPSKSTASADPLSELVATARRERKVQDLEITNASLEAINRTLERQLRKQTAELRRYRRLSRGGRLSAGVASVRSRVVSGSTVDDGGPLAVESLDLSDFTEEEESEEQDESDLSDTESTASTEMTSGAIAARDAAHRKRDEERLMLDLSKHQQLLIDSQKLNQSIKRCLSRSEDLIKEGKRALEYQVRVSEVELGGRVLSPDGEEEQYVFDGMGVESWQQDDSMTSSEAPSPTYTGENETIRLKLEQLKLEDTASEAARSPTRERHLETGTVAEA